jgi:hypothetical protein
VVTVRFIVLTRVQMIKTGLVQAGYKPEIRELSSFQDDYGWKADDDEEDGNDDDDDNDNDSDDDDEEDEEDVDE